MMTSFATWTMTRPPARFATISSSRSCASAGMAAARERTGASSRHRDRDEKVPWLARVGKGLNIPTQSLRAFAEFFTGITLSSAPFSDARTADPNAWADRLTYRQIPITGLEFG